jgi:hypothetical protein
MEVITTPKRYDYFEEGMGDPESLNYWYYEKNNFFFNNFHYKRCLNRYFKQFNRYNDLKKELESPNINLVCKKELDGLKAAVENPTLKEILGFSKLLYTQDITKEIDK